MYYVDDVDVGSILITAFGCLERMPVRACSGV